MHHILREKPWQFWVFRIFLALVLGYFAFNWRCTGEQCWEGSIVWIFFYALFLLVALELTLIRSHSIFTAYAFVTMIIVILLSYANFAISLRTCSLSSKELEAACHNPKKIDPVVMQHAEKRKRAQGLGDEVSHKKELEESVAVAMGRCLYIYTGKAVSFNFLDPDERVRESQEICHTSTFLDSLWGKWYDQSLEEAFTPTNDYPKNLKELKELRMKR